MEKIRVGILGYGFMGHVHVRDLSLRDDMEIVAVCDIEKEKMQDAPETVARYTAMEDVIARKDIDVVIIAIPNHLHLEAIKLAARAGKDIICEKPVVMSLQEFAEVETIVKKTGIRFTVHQQRRFDRDFRTAKRVYDSGTLGKVYTIQSSLYGINGNMHDWHVYKKYGGGMLYDWGVHLLDQMLWMVQSEVISVYADIRNVINAEVDDYFKILLNFENGVTGEVELGTYFLADREKWFERHWFIGGNKGTMYADGFEPSGKICRTSRLLTNVPGKTTITAAGPTRSFGPPQPGVLLTEELQTEQTKHSMFFDNYVNAYWGKEEFLVTLPELHNVLSVMEAARLSAGTGKSISLHCGRDKCEENF